MTHFSPILFNWISYPGYCITSPTPLTVLTPPGLAPFRLPNTKRGRAFLAFYGQPPKVYYPAPQMPRVYRLLVISLRKLICERLQNASWVLLILGKQAFIQIHYESVSIHPNTLRILLGAFTSVHSPFTLPCTTLVKTLTLYPETKSFVQKKTLSCAKETPGVQCFISQQISVQDTLFSDKGHFFCPQFCEVGRLVITCKRT